MVGAAMSGFERFVMLPGDIEIAYAEQGAGDGIPVILLHGYADSWRSFEPLLDVVPMRVVDRNRSSA